MPLVGPEILGAAVCCGYGSLLENRKHLLGQCLRAHAQLGGRFGSFYFSARGRGRGSPQLQEEGGVGFLLEIQEGRLLPGEGWGGPRGREGVCREFFSGPKCPPSQEWHKVHQFRVTYLLTQNYYLRIIILKIITLTKITNFTRNSLKSLSFLES